MTPVRARSSLAWCAGRRRATGGCRFPRISDLCLPEEHKIPGGDAVGYRDVIRTAACNISAENFSCSDQSDDLATGSGAVGYDVERATSSDQNRHGLGRLSSPRVPDSRPLLCHPMDGRTALARRPRGSALRSRPAQLTELVYANDFGDCWEHEVRVEARADREGLAGADGWQLIDIAHEEHGRARSMVRTAPGRRHRMSQLDPGSAPAPGVIQGASGRYADVRNHSRSSTKAGGP
jgi:hypothetical protein